MKKIINKVSLIAVVLILGIFVLTGCENGGKGGNTVITINGVNVSLNKERTLCNLNFKYPEEAKFPTEEENHITMKIYQDDNEEKILASVVVTVRKEKNVEEYIKNMRNVEASELQTETYNDTKWYIYDYKSSNAIAKVHYCQNGQDTYVVSFPQEGDAQNIDITNFKTEFMKNVRFGNSN